MTAKSLEVDECGALVGWIGVEEKMLRKKRSWENLVALPFTTKTISILAVILMLFATFYLVDLPFHPFIAICLKSVVVSALYIVIVYKIKVSKDVNELIDGVIKKK